MPITQWPPAWSKPPSENRRGHQSATRAEPESAWATKMTLSPAALGSP